MYRVHGDKVIRRRTNYRKENDIQKYTKILKILEICVDIVGKILI